MQRYRDYQIYPIAKGFRIYTPFGQHVADRKTLKAAKARIDEDF